MVWIAHDFLQTCENDVDLIPSIDVETCKMSCERREGCSFIGFETSSSNCFIHKPKWQKGGYWDTCKPGPPFQLDAFSIVSYYKIREPILFGIILQCKNNSQGPTWSSPTLNVSYKLKFEAQCGH